MQVKKCSKCNVEKCYTEYYKRKGGLFGLHAQCKKCFYLASKSSENQRKKKERDKKYYLRSKRAKSAANRAWRKNNPDYFKDYVRRKKEQEIRVKYGADSQGTGFDSGG